MNIEEMNKKHLLRSDMLYRVSFGLSSKLLAFKNGIISIEVLYGKRWKKSYKETALEMAYNWRDKNPELGQAIGCKVYIVDAHKFPYKKDLYLNTGVVSYDAKEGVLFYKNISN